VPDALLALVARNSRAAERKQVGQLLGLWDTRLLCAVAGVSFHIMGSARMGASERDSVCDPSGQTWAVRGLYVFDGAAFPTASGVNPMVTIEALAHMTARGLAARLS
jgi:choline dehydrogenase-like flavoprotein